MLEESFDKLYGNKGVDTKYERDQIEYRPDINYKKEQLQQILSPDIQQSIERSRTFTITHNLIEYDELVREIDQMLVHIEERNNKSLMAELKSSLIERDLKGIISFERKQSGYNQTGDFELYSLLYHMRDSAQTRRDFIDDMFRTQITNETEIDKIEEAEELSIRNWEQLEARVLDGYEALAYHDHDEEHAKPHDSDSLTTSSVMLSYEELEELEREKRNSELFHVSLADTSYIHRNRYFMFFEVVEKAKILTYQAEELISNELGQLIMGLSELRDIPSAKVHLILQFRKIKEKHEALKGRMMTIDDEKESFASEKQYMYQQMDTKTVEPLKEWLYNQEENISGAIDIFSEYLVDSLQETRKTYESTLADMLNFYQSESDFYGEQIGFMKNKEQIRRFFSILEDLEDVDQIREDWVKEYLKANGYTS